MTSHVAGVDGCRAGWITVVRSRASPSDAALTLLPTFQDVLSHTHHCATVAVDIPIGFPEHCGIGGRPADIAARANLGARQSAVFAVPSRRAVAEHDYRRACDAAFATSTPPRKISKQTFFLFPKMREVDALMTPALQSRVIECHPELAFWALNGERALDEPKKVKSRPYEPGLELRRRLLRNAGYDPTLWRSATLRARDAGPDDILDALANSWSAARIADGKGRRFPASPDRDARGLAMAIWC
jgi:predicted RNase H-like nuclease